MDIAEIRFLEGPNPFLLEPAVKVEIVTDASEQRALSDRFSALLDRDGPAAGWELAPLWAGVIARICELAGEPVPATAVVQLDDEDRLALVYGWSHRSFAGAVAETIRALVESESPVGLVDVDRLRTAAAAASEPPEMVTDADRFTFSVAITGTNGKTTTTRLLAHIARTAGLHVGWSSTSGIYIDGTSVEDGDYSGPSGARRVLTHGGLDLAIVETARGGILLKGLGYESNDVSVFTNVSGDHLGLNGVLTVESLADVKAVVCRVTRPDGIAVVNADDDLVMSATDDIRSPRCLVSRSPNNPRVSRHRADGGRVVVLEGESIVARDNSGESFRMDVTAIPMCFGGKAGHQIENAMCAVGAALASKLPVDAIRAGLTSFGSEPDHNPGRLNVFDMGTFKVVLDYAHNEAGLERLIAFGRELGGGNGRVVAIIGSAGDRDPAMLRSLGRIAAEQSDHVVAKGTDRYLRGIAKDELFRLYREGAETTPATPYEEVDDEWTAARNIPAMARDGDVFVLMFQEAFGDVQRILAEASRR